MPRFEFMKLDDNTAIVVGGPSSLNIPLRRVSKDDYTETPVYAMSSPRL
jgi:hypothetical protein